MTTTTRLQPNDRYLSVDALRADVASGAIDTVVVALTDMQGRLQGKRMHAAYFLDHVLEANTEGCNYLLAVDVEMNTVDGYALTSWESGYGDLEFALDLATLRRLPYEPGAAMVQCDLVQLDHSPVPQSPRTMLTTQLDRLAERGLVALAGTELEFIAFQTSYEDAWRSGYRDLVPVNQYNVDYSILGGARAEPLLREIRNAMYGAGMDVESAKGECNLGQHEIGFLYADALTTADNHAVYKTAAKQIAAARGQSLTFMAKYNEREGSSCHIHLSLRGADGSTTFWEDGARSQGVRPASSPACWRPWHDFTLLYAPNVNSYKRLRSTVRSRRRRSPGARTTAPAPYAWSATAGAPGLENRRARRRREPLPRDRGDDRGRPARDRRRSRAGAGAGRERVLLLRPAEGSARPCATPAPRSAGSAVARSCFGDDVVDHYTNGWPTSSWPRSTPRSPTGSCGAASSGCEHAVTSSSTPDSVGGRQPRDRAGHHDRRAWPTSRRPTRRSNGRPSRVRRGGATSTPGERARLLRSVRAYGRGARRRARRPRGAQRRAHDRERPVGGRPGLPSARVLRRFAGTDVRSADPGPGRGGRHVPRAARRRRADRARGTSRCSSPSWGFAPALAAG